MTLIRHRRAQVATVNSDVNFAVQQYLYLLRKIMQQVFHKTNYFFVVSGLRYDRDGCPSRCVDRYKTSHCT